MNSSRSVIQEDPPATQKIGTDYEVLVAEIRELGGEWCRLGTDWSPAMAAYIRNGRQRAFLPEGMETDSDEARAYMKSHWSVRTRTTSKSPHRLAIYVKALS